MFSVRVCCVAKNMFALHEFVSISFELSVIDVGCTVCCVCDKCCTVCVSSGVQCCVSKANKVHGVWSCVVCCDVCKVLCVCVLSYQEQ